MPTARTHLKRSVGNTDDNLRNWVQLPGVNVLVLRGCGITDLCEGSAKFESLVQRLFHRSAHHWGVFL